MEESRPSSPKQKAQGKKIALLIIGWFIIAWTTIDTVIAVINKQIGFGIFSLLILALGIWMVDKSKRLKTKGK